MIVKNREHPAKLVICLETNHQITKDVEYSKKFKPLKPNFFNNKKPIQN